MSVRPSLLDRVPLKPGAAAGVFAAALTLVIAEFVRSGLYGGYFTQVIDTKYGLPVALGGLVFTVHIVADTVMRAAAGVAIHKFGPRVPVLGGALLSLAAISLLLLPITHSALSVLCIAALHGIGFSPMWPALVNLTADAALPGYEGRTLSIATSALMPLVGLGFVVYGLVAKKPEIPIMLFSVGLLGLGALASTLLPAHRIVGKTDEPKPKGTLTRALIPLLPAAMMQVLTQSIVGNWLFRMAPDLGLTNAQLIALLAVGGVVAFACFPWTGKLADSGRARVAITIGFLLCGAGMLGFALKPPLWALFMLAPVAGIGYAFITPGWAALVTQSLPEAQRPAAWGVIMTVESASMALGPTIGGLMYGAAGASGPFGLNAALCLITAAGYVLFRHLFVTPSPTPPTSTAPVIPAASSSGADAGQGPDA